jgi:hypothetical protein
MGEISKMDFAVFIGISLTGVCSSGFGKILFGHASNI